MEEFHSFYYDQMQREPVTSDFTVPVGTVLTPELLQEIIDDNEDNHLPRYQWLDAAYNTKYKIFDPTKAKADYKADNRLAADMAYDITETFEGYFIGNPIQLRSDKQDFLDEYEERNFQEDVNADLSKMCSKFGHAYEMLYQDDDGLPRSVALTPRLSFMVYDDSVLHRPLWFVRYSYDEDGHLKGSYSDSQNVVPFSDEEGTLLFGEPQSHYFGAVPAIEYKQNTEKRGLYEGVLNLIEAYNKVLSEKANDVDYFADSYMVVTGQELPDDFKKDLKEYRLINLFGGSDEDGASVQVEFLAKPNGDTTQENLIDRLEMLIFKMAMVPDITDESFSTASGIALKMRLLPMSNMAKNKERKFKRAIKERLRLLANYPNQNFSGDDWMKVEITMQRNMPEDLASEASIAGSLSGIVSEETQLSVLSVVDDPEKEIERKQEEQNKKNDSLSDRMPLNRTKEETDETDRTVQRQEEAERTRIA
jgi:SPP1 family phage portal protein